MTSGYTEFNMLKTQTRISQSQDLQSVDEQFIRVNLVNHTRNEDLKYESIKIRGSKEHGYNAKFSAELKINTYGFDVYINVSDKIGQISNNVINTHEMKICVFYFETKECSVELLFSTDKKSPFGKMYEIDKIIKLKTLKNSYLGIKTKRKNIDVKSKKERALLTKERHVKKITTPKSVFSPPKIEGIKTTNSNRTTIDADMNIDMQTNTVDDILKAINKIDEQTMISPEETINVVENIHKKMEILCSRQKLSENELLELRKAKDMLRIKCNDLMDTTRKYRQMMFEIDDKMKHTERQIILEIDNIKYLESEYDKYVNMVEQQNKDMFDYKTEIETIKHELFVWDDKYKRIASEIDEYEKELHVLDKRNIEHSEVLNNTCNSVNSLNVLKTMITEMKRELLHELNRLSQNESEIEVSLKNNTDKIDTMKNNVTNSNTRQIDINEILKERKDIRTDITEYINEMKSKYEFMKSKLGIKQQNLQSNINIRDIYASYIKQHQALNKHA